MLITTPRSLLSSHPLPSIVPIPLLLTPPPMKDRRGGAGIFPFSIGCMSQSAVSVADPHGKKQPQNDPSSSSSSSTTNAESAEEGGGEKARSAAAVVAAGVQRLIKGIKSLSQMFAMYDDEEEGEEREMVIGFPTDVQHVGHIGWDGLNKVDRGHGHGERLLPPSPSGSSRWPWRQHMLDSPLRYTL